MASDKWNEAKKSFYFFKGLLNFALRVILIIHLNTKAVWGRVLCPSLFFTSISSACKFCCILLSFALS